MSGSVWDTISHWDWEVRGNSSRELFEELDVYVDSENVEDAAGLKLEIVLTKW